MAHSIEWQWRDTGSGPGRMQRVIVYDDVEDEAQTAYRAFLVHSASCETCKRAEVPCEAGRELGKAYRAARRRARQH
ncbi:hypothetical protein ACIQ8G_03740 [Streptomyces sp. NPDC094154]|uniref:hypothetical protein n=1 Tax=Streptomyces sp. NPDC094154 TaxID=3366059 RepID=UPI003822B128